MLYLSMQQLLGLDLRFIHFLRLRQAGHLARTEEEMTAHDTVGILKDGDQL